MHDVHHREARIFKMVHTSVPELFSGAFSLSILNKGGGAKSFLITWS